MANHRSSYKPTYHSSALQLSASHGSPQPSKNKVAVLKARFFYPAPPNPQSQVLPLLPTHPSLWPNLVTALNRPYPFLPPHLCTDRSSCWECPPPFASPSSLTPYTQGGVRQSGLDSGLCHLPPPSDLGQSSLTPFGIGLLICKTEIITRPNSSGHCGDELR